MLLTIHRDTSYDNPLREGISLHDGKVKVSFRGDGGKDFETKETYHDGQWHHVAHAVGGQAAGNRLYVDGKLAVEGTMTGLRTGWWHVPSERMSIDLGPGDDKCHLTLDDVRVYGRALSEGQVGKLYQAVPTVP